MNILVGTAGFSYKDWEGIVYPADLKTRKVPPLQYLARFYDCCEINTSFYGPLRPSTGKQWCATVNEVNPNFVFTAKLLRTRRLQTLSRPRLQPCDSLPGTKS
jgi:uncharacterized protein YecE (DUF72 family)